MGGGADYQRRHQAVYRARGRACDHQCAKCTETGHPRNATDWAQVHGESGDDPWADYVPLCRRCHIRYDRGGQPGRKKTQDEKDRISAKLKGRRSPTTGMKFTDETRQKMRASSLAHPKQERVERARKAAQARYAGKKAD